MRRAMEEAKERLLDYGFLVRNPLFVLSVLILRRSRAMRKAFFGASGKEDRRARGTSEGRG